MKMEISRDEWSPAVQKLIANASCEKRQQILAKLGSRLSNEIKRNIAGEKNYDGTPMKSPSLKTKFGGRFAKSYKWRYRPGWRLLSAEEEVDLYNARVLHKKHQDVLQRITKSAKGKVSTRHMVRRRIPVTEDSKQLQDTGATIKSIDILSADCNRATVGPKTGHGQKVLRVHQENKNIPAEKRRRPLGISNGFAQKASEYVLEELTKGV